MCDAERTLTVLYVYKTLTVVYKQQCPQSHHHQPQTGPHRRLLPPVSVVLLEGSDVCLLAPLLSYCKRYNDKN